MNSGCFAYTWGTGQQSSPVARSIIIKSVNWTQHAKHQLQ